MVDVREWNDADGTIQLQLAFAEGVPVHIPDDLSVPWEEKLVLPADAELRVDGALINVGVSNTGGTVGAFIQTQGLRDKQKADHIHIHGHGSIGSVDWSYKCNLFALYGDNILLERFSVPKWAGGRAFVLAGDDMEMYRVKFWGSPPETNNGGVRFVGGKGFRGWALTGVSGDDLFQFVPSGNPQDPLYDMNISDGWYYDGVGQSIAARPMVAGIQNPNRDDQLNMTCSITDVGWVNYNGIGGAAALVVQNLNSTGTIDGVTVAGGSTDMGASAGPTLGQEVYVRQNPGTGGVTGVNVEHTIRNPRTRLYRTVGDPGVDLTRLHAESIPV